MPYGLDMLCRLRWAVVLAGCTMAAGCEYEEKVLKNSFLNFKEIPNNHFYSYT